MITDGTLNKNKDQGREKKFNNASYAIINVENLGQGFNKGIIPTLFTKQGSLSSKCGFWVIICEKNHRRLTVEYYGHRVRQEIMARMVMGSYLFI